MDQESVTDEITAVFTQQAQKPLLENPKPKWIISSSMLPEELSNGSHAVETTLALHCPGDSEGVITEDDHLTLSNDGMSEFSNSDISLPEVCISSNSKSFEEEINHEVQQAYRIFSGFLSEKHKVITNPFVHSVGNQEAKYGIGGVRSRGHLRQSMCLRRMEEKFINQEYETITEFVADFRQMLENCYRYHGVDHWLSKQAQKLEIMLEQKLTLLSRTLREKTTLAVTSKGRFGVEEERVSTTSSRRRQAPRTLGITTVGGNESIMVKTLRVEEQQKAKEEKRQRDLEKKEAEEISAKEMDEWERSLLLQASPHSVETLWELPAIGHFLCLAQTALNLPEIVFFELERCLLMPRCSTLLSKIMSSLLCPPQRRSTLHRRPVLPYRRWESELRQRVKVWYQSIGTSHDQAAQAEQLGLGHQFFSVLGEVSPLEAKAFHMLPFYQRIWLLKGLCDHVYETQKDVQDAVLGQPIHECRESILGYDSKDNAYIHFPHFCGADLRIYCQSSSMPPTFPFPSVLVKKVEILHKVEEEVSNVIKDTSKECGIMQYDGPTSSSDYQLLKVQKHIKCKKESSEGEDNERCQLWKTKETVQLKSTDEDSSGKSKVEPNVHTNALSGPIRKRRKEEWTESEHKSKRIKVKEEAGISRCNNETVIHEPCLSVGEHCYTGRSPASTGTAPPSQKLRIKTESPTQKDQKLSCLESCKNKIGQVKSEHCGCCSRSLDLATQLSSENTHTSCDEKVSDKMRTMKKRRKKKRGKEPLLRTKREHKRLQPTDRRPSPAKTAKCSVQKRSTATKTKDKKKQKEGQNLDLSKKNKPQAEPSFKLICTNLDDLRGLINKTEDELDDLESTKKRLDRWYYRKESVKELHSTFIRLLNELSPWEPKLIKAYQRNRLRLKKEYEVFKNHPEYNNFVREECMSSSSSSSSSDDEEGRELGLLSEQDRQSEQDLDRVLPRGLWIGVNGKDLPAVPIGETPVTHISHNHQSVSTTGDSLELKDTVNIITQPKTGQHCKHELNNQSQSSDSNSAQAPSVLFHTILSSKPAILHTTTGLPKGYTPIPTLLAKSVGNKVTLIKQPADYYKSENGTTTKLTKNSLPVLPQNIQQMHKENLKQTLKEPVMDTVVATLPVLSQSKAMLPKKNVHLSFNVNEKLNHLVSSSNTNESNEENRLQQVATLPPNLLVHKVDKKVTKGILDPNAKMDTTLCMSTNVAGFTIPENTILVQQMASLKDIGKTRTSVISTNLSCPFQPQQSAVNTARSKGAPTCDIQTSTPQCAPNNATLTSVVPSFSKSVDLKQELKTVCIRESQSILVTTRGGNTGIVKVQKSADQNRSLTCSPVIKISPQFKAFLVSKTSPVFSSTTAPQSATPSAVCTSTTQTQIQIPSLKTSHTITTHAVTDSISQQASQTPSTALCKGMTGSVCYTLTTKTGGPVPVVTTETHLPSLSNVSAPSLSITQPASKSNLKQTNTDDRSQVAKFILVTTTSSSSPNVNVSCSKALPTSLMLISQPTAKSMMPFQGPSTVLKQAATTAASRQLVMKSPSSQKMVSHISSVNSVPLTKNKYVPVFSVCKDTEKIISSTAQIPFINSNVTSSSSSLASPTSSLTSLGHHGISSITISQPGSFPTCPNTNLFSAANSKKKQGVLNIISASNTDVLVAKSQSSSNPILVSSMKHPSLSNLNTNVDKTNLSSQQVFTKNNPTLLKPTETAGNTKGVSSTTNAFKTCSTSTVQQQIVINTSAPLAGGTRIVLNNTHFVVPPQGLGSGSHVLVISSQAPQVPSTSNTTTGATEGFPRVNHATVGCQAPVVLQTSTKLPSVPAINSPFVACTPAIASPIRSTTCSVTTASLTGPSPTLPSLQSANLVRPAGGSSMMSALPNVDTVLPLISAVLTNTPVASFTRAECLTTTTATSAPSLSGLSPPPPLSSTVFHRPATVVASLSPVKADPAPLLPVTATSYSQGLFSPTHSKQDLSATTITPQLPSQHPTIRFGAISSSSSTALLHLGLSSTSVQKQEPVLIQPVLTGAQTNSVLPVPAFPTVVNEVSRVQALPCFPIGSTIKSVESSSSSDTAHESVAQPDTQPKTVLHPPVIVTQPALEKHLLHTPVASKLLCPDGVVLSTVQGKVMSTFSESTAGLFISPLPTTGALCTPDLFVHSSQMNSKSDS